MVSVMVKRLDVGARNEDGSVVVWWAQLAPLGSNNGPSAGSRPVPGDPPPGCDVGLGAVRSGVGARTQIRTSRSLQEVRSFTGAKRESVLCCALTSGPQHQPYRYRIDNYDTASPLARSRRRRLPLWASRQPERIFRYQTIQFAISPVHPMQLNQACKSPHQRPATQHRPWRAHGRPSKLRFALVAHTSASFRRTFMALLSSCVRTFSPKI